MLEGNFCSIPGMLGVGWLVFDALVVGLIFLFLWRCIVFEGGDYLS